MKTIQVPNEIEQAVKHGAAIVVSVSGGKDSQAVLNATVALCQARGWLQQLFVVHADLGRIEWSGTQQHIEHMCQATGVAVDVVSAGDMVDRWKARMSKLAGTGKPFWSSAAQRYCTSDMKRNPIDKYLRQWPCVVSIDGVRADESPARAKQSSLSVREQITTKTLQGLSPAKALEGWLELQAAGTPGRLALNWHAIHEWSIDDVWQACGTSAGEVAMRRRMFAGGDQAGALRGAVVHHAYIRGNDRLSCSLCVLASESDLRNGAADRPEVARELVSMEQQSGFTFKHKKSLASIIAGVIALEPAASEAL